MSFLSVALKQGGFRKSEVLKKKLPCVVFIIWYIHSIHAKFLCLYKNLNSLSENLIAFEVKFK